MTRGRGRPIGCIIQGVEHALPPGQPVTVGASTVNVVALGEGPSILLLHGWPETSRRWRDVAGALARHHHVVAMDLPGFGDSGPSPGGYTTPALAATVLDVMSQLGVATFDVAGHDWGGSVAYALAATARDRVTRLVVEEELLPGFRVNPDGAALGTYPVWHGDFHRIPDLPEVLVRGHEDAYYGYFWDLTAEPGAIGRAARDEYLRTYASPGALSAGLALYRAAEEDARHNRALAAAPLTIPVLAVGGSRAIGHGVARSLACVAGDVREHVVHACGHYPAEEHPGEWLRVVEGFLSGDVP